MDSRNIAGIRRQPERVAGFRGRIPTQYSPVFFPLTGKRAIVFGVRSSGFGGLVFLVFFCYYFSVIIKWGNDMQKGMVLLFLLCSSPVIGGGMTQDQVLSYNECFPVLKELKWLKSMRDQGMETNGKKNIAEIEKDWQDRSRHLGCGSYQNEFDRRNP